MSNPWLTKNPFMSMWLSAANSVAGSMRGHAIAEANRQVKAAVVEAISLPFRAPKALTKRRTTAKTKVTVKAKPRVKR